MSIPFFGRKKELATLEKLFKKNEASLVVVKGRRRVGKSRLIQEFAKKHTFYQFSGPFPSPETTAQSQRDEFAGQLSNETGLPRIVADDWSTLFRLLAEKTKTGRIIVLFDEISWMGSKDPHFLAKFMIAWDTLFKSNPKLIFFLCGSVSSWIEKNIFSSTGFVGRISLRITLQELPLAECNEFWRGKDRYISAYEKLKILSVTGGIPRYLAEIDPTVSAEKNIKSLCFTPSGHLVHEFNDIFSDIFEDRSTIYKGIIELLADGPLELTDLSKRLGITFTGTLSSYLKDLVSSDFVSRDYTWHFRSGEISKFSHFRLSDNYVRFYLKYIEPELPRIENGDFEDVDMGSLPGWETIMGYQFENLVLKNRRYIKEALRINPQAIVSDNPYFQRATKSKPGYQIDYLIQTKFGGLYMCELKFTKQPVGMKVIKEMQQKIEKMSYPKGFSIWPVLIHVNGVEDEVIQSGFFAEIIDFGSFLQSYIPPTDKN